MPTPPPTTRTAPILNRGGLPSPSSAPMLQTPGGPPSAAALLPQTLQLPLPWVVPIPDAQFFTLQGTKSTAAAEQNVLIPNVQLIVEAGVEGVIDGFVFSVQNLVVTSNLTFSLLFNGNPVQGFKDLLIFPANLALSQFTWSGVLRVPQNTKVEVSYTNTAGDAHLVGADVTGWTWATASGQAWLRGGVS